MASSMIQVVNELISGGHQVDFYIRKDGGILIRRIDNEHFSGAHGNARARQMVGAQLSEARFKQLKYATQVRMHPVKIEVKDSIKEEYQRVKKLWNKAFKAKGGKPHQAGYFGWKRIKTAIKEYGEEEALRRIGEAEKYASGYAYTKNVQHLASYVLDAGAKLQSDALLTLAQDIYDNAYSIKEEWIYPAYEKLYELNHGVDPKQVAQEVRRVLRL